MSDEQAITRRTFMGACTACALAVPGVALFSSCAVQRLQSDLPVDLTQFPELATEGETVLVDAGLRQPIAITRIGPGESDYRVLGTECNHLNCGVNTSATGFDCPCHGSKFAADGTLLEGPATADLPRYDFVVNGQAMVILTPII
jgi:cytochrome b6-f complex iron-sulfur subunit